MMKKTMIKIVSEFNKECKKCLSWGRNVEVLLGKKGYEARSNFSDKSKMRKSKRYCYQCGDPNHFIAACPNKEGKKEEKEKSKYKRKSFDHKGKPYKPDKQKDLWDTIPQADVFLLPG
nr:zinc finger CCHC-type and RNA-binding motif-containing protein 1-like [Aegilops tauschii subsp. strangulata]